jgi:hypothetical protein
VLANNRHYWRGVIDGDGYLGIALHRGKPQVKLELCGSEPTVGQFSSYVSQRIFPHKSHVIAMKRIYRITFAGSSAQRIVEHLYTDTHTA